MWRDIPDSGGLELDIQESTEKAWQGVFLQLVVHGEV